jgi:outer membrane immunogenic protein
MRKLLCAILIAAASGHASAADLPAMPGPAAVVYVPAYLWSGFYFGGYAGGRWASIKDDTGVAAASVSGWTGGGIVGGNFQIGSFVYGVEGDFGGGDTTGGNAAAGGLIVRGDIRASGNLRVRAGWAMDRVLFFAAGGAAFANPGITTAVGYLPHWVTGWTAGGGIDYAVWAGLILRAEYLFSTYGDKVYAFGAPVPASRLISLEQLHTLRGAVMWKF